MMAQSAGAGRPTLRLGTDPADFTERDVQSAAQLLRPYFGVTTTELQTGQRGAPGVRAVEVDFDWTAAPPAGLDAVMQALRVLWALHADDQVRCAFSAPTVGIACDLQTGDPAALWAAVQTLPATPGHYGYAGDTSTWTPAPPAEDESS
jgi:hypothetical protein